MKEKKCFPLFTLYLSQNMIENDQVALIKFEKFSNLLEQQQKDGGKRRKPEETLEAQRSVTRRPIKLKICIWSHNRFRYKKKDTPLRY
jgi:hypothetical protein